MLTRIDARTSVILKQLSARLPNPSLVLQTFGAQAQNADGRLKSSAQDVQLLAQQQLGTQSKDSDGQQLRPFTLQNTSQQMQMPLQAQANEHLLQSGQEHINEEGFIQKHQQQPTKSIKVNCPNRDPADANPLPQQNGPANQVSAQGQAMPQTLAQGQTLPQTLPQEQPQGQPGDSRQKTLDLMQVAGSKSGRLEGAPNAEGQPLMTNKSGMQEQDRLLETQQAPGQAELLIDKTDKKLGAGVSQRDEINKLTLDILNKLPIKGNQDPSVLSNLQVKTYWTVDKATRISSKALSARELPPDNQKVEVPQHLLDANQQQKKGGKLLGRIKNVFGLLRRKRKVNYEYYEDFDTDDGEDLNTVPPWRKNRLTFNDDLEDEMKPPKSVIKVPLYFGNSRDNVQKISDRGKAEAEVSAYAKCFFIKEKEGQDIEQKTKSLQDVMKPQEYVCRIYVTKGIGLPLNQNQQCYLMMELANKTKSLKGNSKRQGCSSPEFYIYEDLLCELPGSAFLTISVMSDEGMLGSDEIVGQTQVDLEDRFFNIKWQKLNKDPKKFVPIEQRSLAKPGSGAVGRLELWIELIPKNQVKNRAPIQIAPEPRYEMELRCIVWDTRDCVYKDEVEKCNDLFVKGGPANQPLMETDIHWRCRQKGSFNWRWKFKQRFPMTIEDYGSDKFKVGSPPSRSRSHSL